MICRANSSMQKRPAFDRRSRRRGMEQVTAPAIPATTLAGPRTLKPHGQAAPRPRVSACRKPPPMRRMSIDSDLETPGPRPGFTLDGVLVNDRQNVPPHLKSALR